MAGGDSYYGNQAYMQQLADNTANHASVYNNPAMWIVDKLVMQFAGVHYDLLPPNMLQVLNMFVPSLLNMIPDTMNMTELYSSILSAVNSSGKFNGADPGLRTGAAHTMLMMVNSRAYGVTGLQNLTMTGGMSGKLLGQVTGAMVQDILKESGSVPMRQIDMFLSLDTSIDARMNNLVTNAKQLLDLNKINQDTYNYYQDVSSLHNIVMDEAALVAGNGGNNLTEEQILLFRSLDAELQAAKILSGREQLLKLNNVKRDKLIQDSYLLIVLRHNLGLGSMVTDREYTSNDAARLLGESYKTGSLKAYMQPVTVDMVDALADNTMADRIQLLESHARLYRKEGTMTRPEHDKYMAVKQLYDFVENEAAVDAYYNSELDADNNTIITGDVTLEQATDYKALSAALLQLILQEGKRRLLAMTELQRLKLFTRNLESMLKLREQGELSVFNETTYENAEQKDILQKVINGGAQNKINHVITRNSIELLEAATETDADKRIENMIKNAKHRVETKQMDSTELLYYERAAALHQDVSKEAALQYMFRDKQGELLLAEINRFKASSAEEKQAIIRKAQSQFKEVSDSDTRKKILDLTRESIYSNNWFGGGLFTGVKMPDQTYNSILENAYNNGTYDATIMDDATADEFSSKLERLMPKVGRNIALLSKIFLTDNFDELLDAADALGWGVLTSEKSVDKIRRTLDTSYAMAAATQRDMLSVLTERKELTGFAAVAAGGKQYVSLDYIDDLQRVRNLAMYNESIDAVKSQDLVVADYVRIHENDMKYYGNIAAAMTATQDMPEMLGQERTDKLTKLIEQAKQYIASNDVSNAEQTNIEILQILNLAGFTDIQQRSMAKNNILGISRLSSLAAIRALYELLLSDDTESPFDKELKALMVDAMSLGVQLLGTDVNTWKDTILEVQNQDVDSNTTELKVNKLLKRFNLSESYRLTITNLVTTLSDLDKGLLQHLYNVGINGGMTHELVGGITTFQENEAYANDMLTSGDVITDSSDIFENLLLGFLSDSRELTPTKYVKAMISLYKNQHAVSSDMEAIDALSLEGKALEGTLYFGNVDISTKTITDKEEFKLRLNEYLLQHGSSKTADDFLLGDNKDVLNFKALNDEFNGNLVALSNGNLLLTGEQTRRNAEVEARKFSKIDSLDAVSVFKDGGLTEENAARLGLTTRREGDQVYVVGSQYSELIDNTVDDGNGGRRNMTLLEMNERLYKPTAPGQKSIILQWADRQNNTDSALSEINKLATQAVLVLKLIADFVNPARNNNNATNTNTST